MKIQNSELDLSQPIDPLKIILGCGNFGGIGSLLHLYGKDESESESFKILEEAINLGIRRFDTANSYGGCFSEKILGKFIKGLDIKFQKQIYISTKVGNPFAGSKNRNPLDSNEIEFQVEQTYSTPYDH